MINEKDPQVIAMRKLKMTDEEIEDILNCDKAIDRGEKMDFDLSAEEHKKAMKNANADEHKKPTVYDFSKRERKENKPKQEVINAIYAFLTEECPFLAENVEILNKERQISFDFADEKFEITLIQKRKPKN